MIVCREGFYHDRPQQIADSGSGMTAYYNEIDPYAAQWLRNLISAGHIAAGDVDERSIVDVRPEDLKGYTQCHFFAGIGGWSVALRIAGWSDDRPVWTGSCPCQPFSSAGSKKGKSDDRHLWPAWFSLIKEQKPATVFGEQVARAINYGWLDDVYNDLEAQDYAVGAAILPASSVGAKHRRDRLWYVAHAAINDDCGNAGEFSQKDEREENEGQKERISKPSGSSNVRYATSARLPDWAGGEMGEPSPLTEFERPDGREIERDFCGVSHGVSRRMDRLRAYGNAIVPQVAAEFIKATM